VGRTLTRRSLQLPHPVRALRWALILRAMLLLLLLLLLLDSKAEECDAILQCLQVSRTSSRMCQAT
jgi:hypothetical protein